MYKATFENDGSRCWEDCSLRLISDVDVDGVDVWVKVHGGGCKDWSGEERRGEVRKGGGVGQICQRTVSAVPSQR